MGVKTTQRLTRADAVAKYVELKLNDQALKRFHRAQAELMDDTELENTLAELNDRAHGGEGFENYLITTHDL